jgi:uncharacterized membrane protein
VVCGTLLVKSPLKSKNQKIMEQNNIFRTIQNALIAPLEKQNISTNERLISLGASLLLTYLGARSFKKGGFGFLVPAGYLLYRGVSGHCPINEAIRRNTAEGAEPFEFSKSITIRRNKEEVYDYWRDLENLPNILKHVERVEKISEDRYLWTANFYGQRFDWEAEITDDKQGERISWQATGDSDVENYGSVLFTDSTHAGATDLIVTLGYKPANTELGRKVAKIFNPVFKQRVKEDLRSFKRFMETSEVPVTRLQREGTVF